MTSPSPSIPPIRTVLLTLALTLGGCASGPPKPPLPTVVNGTIKVSATVNPSASQRPSPLLLRVYELKSDASFNSADFMALYQRDQAELAADLSSREEYMLEPGETKKFSKKLAPETRFIGVLGAYRDLEHAVWRKIVPVPPSEKPQALLIQANELSIDVALTR